MAFDDYEFVGEADFDEPVHPEGTVVRHREGFRVSDEEFQELLDEF